MNDSAKKMIDTINQWQEQPTPPAAAPTPELKACPMCGGEAHIYETPDGYFVQCEVGGCVGNTSRNGWTFEKDAIQWWNRRPPPERTEAVRALERNESGLEDDGSEGYRWKRRCYLICEQFLRVHNPGNCELEDCDPCSYWCEISGDLGEWQPDEVVQESWTDEQALAREMEGGNELPISGR